MEWLGSLACFTLSFLIFLSFRIIFRNQSSKPLRRPPGPQGWPVIGNIFDLGTLPHQDFYKLKSSYGPVLWLKLGNLNAVVIQSAAAAAELFKKHDLAFADRKHPNSMTASDYINGSMALAPYNQNWRILRRLSASELLDQKRINSSVQLREKCIDKLIQWIKEDASKSRSGGGSGEIQINKYLFMLQEMFLAGTETTSDTTVWAMAELLHNPDSMRKLKAEIDGVIGSTRAVKDDDLNKLPYLKAVVEEAMRLHPALPLLLPRKAREDTEFMGYNIPKDTAVFLNAWAIHRDSESWEDPLAFKPERFLKLNNDHKGQHYDMIPFGSGRRSCVGILMGSRMVSLALARLIQSFDWELPGNVSPETLDVRETTGLSVSMLTPLKAIPIERGA